MVPCCGCRCKREALAPPAHRFLHTALRSPQKQRIRANHQRLTTACCRDFDVSLHANAIPTHERRQNKRSPIHTVSSSVLPKPHQPCALRPARVRSCWTPGGVPRTRCSEATAARPDQSCCNREPVICHAMPYHAAPCHVMSWSKQ